MKRFFLLLTILFASGIAKGERISPKAWSELREIHACYSENVGISWDAKNVDTDAFLTNTLKQYFRSIIEKNKKLVAQNQKLTRERDEALKEARSKTIVLSILTVIILCIIIVPIAWLCLSRRPAGRGHVHSTDKLQCPRCGTEHKADETFCKNCKTHF